MVIDLLINPIQQGLTSGIRFYLFFFVRVNSMNRRKMYQERRSYDPGLRAGSVAGMKFQPGNQGESNLR